MKGIVTLSVILTWFFGVVRSEAGLKDEPPKYSYTNPNFIGSTMKPDLANYPQQFSSKYQQQTQVTFPEHFQVRTQHLQQATPYNHQQSHEGLKKLHQATPVAMVIIAQPAYVPASMLQQGNNVAQQLIQYFQNVHNFPKFVPSNQQFVPPNHQPYYQPPQPLVQARPQYVQSHQSQQSETRYQPSSTAAPASTQPQPIQTQFYSHEALPTPQALVAPQHHVVPHHLNQPIAASQESRTTNYQALEGQLNSNSQQLQQIEENQEVQEPDFAKLAQQAAQHFLMNEGLNPGVKTAPAIITGLELFSPEQQEKIKANLSAHFGSPLKPLNLRGAKNQEQQQQQQQQQQQEHGRTYFDDYRRKLRTDKFVPSIQVKDGEIRQTS